MRRWTRGCILPQLVGRVAERRGDVPPDAGGESRGPRKPHLPVPKCPEATCPRSRLVSNPFETHLYTVDHANQGFRVSDADVEGVLGLPLVALKPGLQWRDYQFNQRAVRDASFARVVKDAYDQTCAFTGLRIRNGGGTSEVEAALILPVAEHGPDSPRNGLALSRTVHWAFDRHLLSMDDDGRTLVSEQLPDEFRRLVRERVRLPADSRLRPHPQFLDRHRGLFRG